MPYWRLYYHVVWSTKRRDPWLVDDLPRLVENAMRNRLHALGVLIHGIALMPDHVHLAVSIPPSRSITSVVSQSKGAPTFLVRQQYADPEDERSFTWQQGYGVLSFGEKALLTVLAYLRNQETHHAEGTFWPRLERTETFMTDTGLRDDDAPYRVGTEEPWDMIDKRA